MRSPKRTFADRDRPVCRRLVARKVCIDQPDAIHGPGTSRRAAARFAVKEISFQLAFSQQTAKCSEHRSVIPSKQERGKQT